MRLALIASVVAVGACAPYPPAPPPTWPPTPPSETQCRAPDYQYLIGRHRSEIPPQPPRETWRVTCTSCPVTMDFSPYRLNILYDQQSGIVREVRCG